LFLDLHKKKLDLHKKMPPIGSKGGKLYF